MGCRSRIFVFLGRQLVCANSAAVLGRHARCLAGQATASVTKIEDKSIVRSYGILQVSEDCSNLEVREAFVRLAKKYHPDSSESPDEERFRSIESAYRSIMEHRKFARPDEEIADAVEKELGFHHRAPAHRQYLSNEGFGYGTPSQRERQYQAFRLNRATENVYNYRVGKLAPYTEDALVTLDKQATKKFKTQNAIERVVEDLIQESMAKGEFTKLSGMGKPLNYADANPFVDSMTHKLNRILINNGFTPEWAVLGKEIENLKAELRQKLTEERAVYGEHPTQQHRGAWADFVQQQQPAIEEINQKVHKFNFICPSIQQQLCQVGLQHFADKIFSGDGWREVSKEKLRENMEKKEDSDAENTNTGGILDLVVLGHFDQMKYCWLH